MSIFKPSPKTFQSITCKVFMILHECIVKEAEKYNSTSPFDQIKKRKDEFDFKNHPTDVSYGYSAGKNIKSSIFQQMKHKLDIKEKKYGLHRTFNGKRLYEYCCKCTSGNYSFIKVESGYLNIYLQFVDFLSLDLFIAEFKSDKYLNTVYHISAEDDLEQIGISGITEESSLIFQKSKVKNKTVTFTQVPSHLCGIYEGFYLNPKDVSETLSRLTLLIAPTGSVNVRTTQVAKKLKKQSYSGSCHIYEENTLSLEFEQSKDNGLFKFHFVLDINDRKNEDLFDGFLKGIHGGSDPINGKPVSGRIIFSIIDTWDSLNNISNIVDYFEKSEKYLPNELTEDEIYNLFNKKGPTLEVRIKSRNPDYDDNKKNFKEFFTTEKRYAENVRIFDKYFSYKDGIALYAGDYSIYSLDSSGYFLNQGIATIGKLGKVKINGYKKEPYSCTFPSSKDEDNLRRYEGKAELFNNNYLSIISYEKPENNNIIFYLIQVEKKRNNKLVRRYNGVRIMFTDSSETKAFASRVIFYREELEFYHINKGLKKIPLIPDSAEEEAEIARLNNLPDCKNLIKYLMGFENNVIKVFDTDRAKMDYKRDIDYKNIFVHLAVRYADKSDENSQNLCILSLHYANLHGFIQMSELRKYFNLNFSHIKDSIIELNNGKYFKIDEDSVELIKFNIKRKGMVGNFDDNL